MFAAVGAILLAIGTVLFVDTGQRHAAGETLQAHIDRIDVCTTRNGTSSSGRVTIRHDAYVDPGDYAKNYVDVPTADRSPSGKAYIDL